MEPIPTAFPIPPVADPIPQFIPQETNGQAVAPPVEEGISAGKLLPTNIHVNLTQSDEIALYDRQIRLWGVQAQEKIRNANILLITMKALANEIGKNLVLAGIHSLTIVDHELVTESDLTRWRHFDAFCEPTA